MARTKKEVQLSAHHAAFVLEKALADRKLSASDVRRYLGQMHEEISHLEERLATLKSATVSSVSRGVKKSAQVVQQAVERVAPKARKARRKVSAEVAASQKLQGQYLGYMRQIPKAKRAFYQKISKANGR